MKRDFVQRPSVLRKGEMVWNLKRVGLDWTQAGQPEKLWLTHYWKCSRTGLMGLWATWFSKRCPWPWHWGWNQISLKMHSNLKGYIILWLHYPMILQFYNRSNEVHNEKHTGQIWVISSLGYRVCNLCVIFWNLIQPWPCDMAPDICD